ncbi:hypothetical protein Scep_012176 [Stephania cephalantha]|uniref:Uncharacterized protein n=1 Tax=Stephania cephalantha TaxID=152367 RepID=A0AAP0JGG3_9MAGN
MESQIQDFGSPNKDPPFLFFLSSSFRATAAASSLHAVHRAAAATGRSRRTLLGAAAPRRLAVHRSVCASGGLRPRLPSDQPAGPPLLEPYCSAGVRTSSSSEPCHRLRRVLAGITFAVSAIVRTT